MTESAEVVPSNHWGPLAPCLLIHRRWQAASLARDPCWLLCSQTYKKALAQNTKSLELSRAMAWHTFAGVPAHSAYTKDVKSVGPGPCHGVCVAIPVIGACLQDTHTLLQCCRTSPRPCRYSEDWCAHPSIDVCFQTHHRALWLLAAPITRAAHQSQQLPAAWDDHEAWYTSGNRSNARQTSSILAPGGDPCAIYHHRACEGNDSP